MQRRRISNKLPVVQADEGITEGQTYYRDIYFKGSFFMHSLRYLIGDSLFFPTLRKLATDPNYTYDHFVTTRDVESLFSTETHRDLKPFFDFYLRTTQVLEFEITETAYQTYKIQIHNFFMPLPIEISSAEGNRRMKIGKDGLLIKSSTPPRMIIICSEICQN